MNSPAPRWEFWGGVWTLPGMARGSCPATRREEIREELAERGGFEPPLRLLTVNRFSKPAPSATRPPLLRSADATQSRPQTQGQAAVRFRRIPTPHPRPYSQGSLPPTKPPAPVHGHRPTPDSWPAWWRTRASGTTWCSGLRFVDDPAKPAAIPASVRGERHPPNDCPCRRAPVPAPHRVAWPGPDPASGSLGTGPVVLAEPAAFSAANRRRASRMRRYPTSLRSSSSQSR